MTALALVGILVFPPALQDPGSLPGAFPFGVLEEVDDEAGGIEFMDDLDWIRCHPYDLNRMSAREILSLPSVTNEDAAAVIAFRKSGGGFQAVDQLSTMDGGSDRLRRALGPYVTVRRHGAEAGLLIRTRVVQTLPAVPGSVGSPVQHCTRVVAQPTPGLEVGGLFVKRAGERMRDGFLSGYLAVRGLPGIAQMIAGDFVLESGLGLVSWKGASIIKSARGERIPWRSGPDAVPNRSTDESRYLRGVAVSAEGSGSGLRWQATGFYSDRTYGADLNGRGEATSFFTGGYTTKEAESKRNTLGEWLYGLRGQLAYAEHLAIGATLCRSRFSRPFHPDDPMRKAGSASEVMGVDLTGSGGPFTVFAEGALLDRQKKAVTCGGRILPWRECSLLAVMRDYAADFDNPHASGFGDNGETRNERGVYGRIDLSPAPWLRLQWTMDQCAHPWPTARSPIPVRVEEMVYMASAEITRVVSIGLRYDTRSEDEAWRVCESGGREVYAAGERQRRRWAVAGSFALSGRILLTTRLEEVQVLEPADGSPCGMFLSQDLHVDPVPGLSLDARVIFFQSDSYDARLYESESDLPGLFSSPPLSGLGSRWYLLLHWTPIAFLSLSARYSATWVEASVSSDVPCSDVPPSHDRKLSLQADLRLF